MARNSLAIDFGSSKTKIYKVGAGLVLSEPTVVALSAEEKPKVRALAQDAKKMVGKTAENTKIVFPVFEGEVVSEKIGATLLEDFLRRIEAKGGLLGSTAVMSVPCGASFELLKKLEAVAFGAGIAKVDFVEAPILAALGQNLTLTDYTPYFIIDMGAGNTNIAVVSMGGVIAGISVNAGGNVIDTALIDLVAEKFGLQIGLTTAEKLKCDVGSLYEQDALATVVNGRDIETGKPRSVSIRSSDIYEVVKTYYDNISELALKVLGKLSPEVSAEVRHVGVYLSGGGAKMFGLEDYFSDKFGMPITLSDRPETAVAFGGGIALVNPALLKKIKIDVK